MSTINETHNPQLKSWLATANLAECDFPIQNLPFAEFRRAGSKESFRGGVAIGDQIVDLAALNHSGLFQGLDQKGLDQKGLDQQGLVQQALAAAAQPTLNQFMAMGQTACSALRQVLSRALAEAAPDQDAVAGCLVPQSEAEYSLPCDIGDYTDFYTSLHHASNVGSLFRPDNPLLPNYKWVPIGYHGRASSIGVSGQTFHRPKGQLWDSASEAPIFGPCKRLDHELELGFFIGVGNKLGSPIPIESAEDHLFGVCLFNDWSARDIQSWEYQPLGPFLAKNFASTISPWLVTMEALAPYRAEFSRPSSDPQPLPYLTSEKNSALGCIDIKLQVLLQTETMRVAGSPPEQIAMTNFVHSYWTVAQLVAHHTVNGCNLRPGDLFGSGTQSGPELEEAGSMLELSNSGKRLITLKNGEKRTFIEDGDTLILRGYCINDSGIRIGLGEVSSTVLPALV
ncbi:fumarylacetoacetase [Halioxenophilus sp. WMMB6]|uniref:fumarylacetoacetase n=1 Tax=Halioxenophilus sp. WMMB6 TaxID=3073815 RepID=UPI00295EA6C5|nr:fumarylacetoacetase [Halioxenophilus sp. WMMB6]